MDGFSAYIVARYNVDLVHTLSISKIVTQVKRKKKKRERDSRKLLPCGAFQTKCKDFGIQLQACGIRQN